MKIYIEFIILFFLLLVFFVWRLWNNRSRKKLLKKYKPEKDKARRKEIFRKAEGREFEIEGRELRNSKPIESSTRYEQLKGREFLPTITSDNVGKTNSSIRKGNPRLRRIRKAFKRKL